MNPVNGIAELIRLLRLDAQNSTRRAPVQGRSSSAEGRGAGPIPQQAESIEQLMGKLKSRIQGIQGQDGVGTDSLDLFVATVLEWKFRDLDEGLDLDRLAVQVKSIIEADPAVKARLEELLRKL